MQTWFHLPGLFFLVSVLFLALVLFLFPCLFSVSVSRSLFLSFSLPLVIPFLFYVFLCSPFSNCFLESCCLSLFIFGIAYAFHYITLCSIPRCSIIFYYVVLSVFRFVCASLCLLLCSCFVLSPPVYSTISYYM